MSVGFEVTKQSLDNQVGSAVVTLREAFDRFAPIKQWLDATADAVLEAAPYGYTSGEVAILKSAVTDMANLAATAHGERAQATPSDFFFFADQLTGIS
jgi:hypothetical protein